MTISLVILGCQPGDVPTQDTRTLDPRAVMEKNWQWHSTVTPVEVIDVAAPERYTIFLTTEGRLKAQFDCNKGAGGFEISAGRLSFGPLISTRMACPPDTLDAQFMRDLQRVKSFFVENGLLYLELPNDSGIMRFRQAQ